ncbi:VPS10 domain-containing protein [Aquimarina rubra]|uniref:T9SS type A sorting domain-containing protein n=1 Tax=Aquimarina rubra TaxID=1920033 RepID=A0ABW5LKD4_9FLAO
MKKRFLFLIVLLLSISVHSQKKEVTRNIQEILSNPFTSKKDGGKRTFDDIIKEADTFFKITCPGLTFAELSQGDFRDGDFVKYQRWKSFWKHHLNEDGTLGDFTQSNISQKRSSSANCQDSDYNAEWSAVNYNGNFGYQIDMGRVSSIGFHPTNPDIFWVGAAFGGIWKTVDGGQSYTNLNDNLPHTAVSDIIVNPTNPDRIIIALSDIVWYGPAGIGIYESNDGGVSFAPTNLTFTLPQNIRIYEIDVNPNNANEFLVATSNGLYRTTDYFNTTTRIINANIRAVRYSLNSNDVYAGGSSGQFYVSTNNGQSFTLSNDFGSGQVRIAVSNKTNSGYVAVTNGSTLNVSPDFGQNFSQKTLPESNCVISFANNSDSNIVVGNFECYASSDGGDNFQATTQWLGRDGLPFIHVDQRNIYTNPLQPDFIYYCNDGGVFRYSVSDRSFANLSSDLFITQYYDIAVSQTDANILGAGSQDNGNVTRNTNGTWQSYEPTADGMGQEIDFNNPANRYYAIQNGALRKWVNGTRTFISPPGEDGNGAWETPFKLDPNNSNRIIIGYNSVYASDNQGSNWTVIGDNISPSQDLEQIAIAKTNSDKIYASRSNVVYAKDAASLNWTSSATPVNQYISDLEVHPTDENTVFISYGGYTNNGKVYKSVDGGNSWQNISYNLPNIPVLSLETYNTLAGSIFIGTYNGVFFLENGTQEWKKYGCLPNTSVNDIEIQYLNEGKIFIGTHGRGIFEASLSPLQCNETVTPYVNNGTEWLQQSTLDVCLGANIYLGMQNVGSQNVQIQYPDGTIDDTPDVSTAWIFNDVQPSDSGSYVVSYNNRSCTAQTTIVLNVQEPLALTPFVNDGSSWFQQDHLEICEGASIYLGVQNAGTSNFEIEYPDGTIDATPDLSTAWQLTNVQPSNSGTYIVRYKNQNACNEDSTQNLTLTVHPSNPDLSDAVQMNVDDAGYVNVQNASEINIETGSDISLRLPSALYSGSLTWTAPNNTSFTSEEISFASVADNDTNVEGNWIVQVDFTNDCNSTSQTMQFTIDIAPALSVSEFDKNTITIYQDPFLNHVYINGIQSSLATDTSVFDISGKLIQKISNESIGQTSQVIDLSSYKNGVYILVFKQGTSKFVKTIIKGS